MVAKVGESVGNGDGVHRGARAAIHYVSGGPLARLVAGVTDPRCLRTHLRDVRGGFMCRLKGYLCIRARYCGNQ